MTVRRLCVDDCEILREVRLRALHDAPFAFGSTYEREAAFAPGVWRDRLGTVGNAHFLWESSEDCPSGLAAVVRDDTGPSAQVVGMWVDPAVRGTGAADALVAAALDFAERERIRTLRLHVTAGNERAERCYERHGFERTGASFVRERDGMREIEMERKAP